MVRVATTAKFPATKVALADVGLFTNLEDADLVANATSGAATFDVDDASAFAIGMWLSGRSVDGFEIVQVTAVDLALNRVTISRAKDGTIAVAHPQGRTFKASIPAVALNQMRDELVAIETFLGVDGECVHWDRGLELEPSSDTCAILTLNLRSARTNKKFIQFSVQDVETGAMVYDTANDAIEFQNIRVDIGTGSDILIEDNRLLRLGTDSDAQIAFDSADNRVEWRSDVVTRFQKVDATELLSIDPSVPAIIANAVTRARTDNALDLGTTAVRWRGLYLGPTSLHVLNAASDANDILHAGSAGFQMGAGGASALDVTLVRQAASIYKVIGNLAGDVRFGMSGAANAFVALRAATADAQPYFLADNTGFNLGAGGASVVDWKLSRTGANAAAVAAGDTFAITDMTVGSVLFITAGGVLSQDNSNFFWDDSLNALAIGKNTTTITVAGTVIHGHITVHDDDAGGSSAAQWHRHSATAGFGPKHFFVRSRGTAAAQTVVSSGDNLGQIDWLGHDGTDYEYAASILAEVDGAPGAGDMPGRIIFKVSPDGSATPAEAMRISQNKDVLLQATLTINNQGAGADVVLQSNDAAQRANLAGHWDPSADSTWDLGTNLIRWATGYFDTINAGAMTSGHILPAADNTYDLGSASFRWRDVYATGSSFRVISTQGDANPTARLGSALLAFGAGGASATDIQYARQAASIVELTGSLAGSVRYGMSGAATPFLALRLAAADANAVAQVLTDRVSFGAGGASAVDYSLIRTGANTGTLSGHIRPSATATYDLGSATETWNNIHVRTINIDNQGAGADPILSSNSAAQRARLAGELIPATDNTFLLGDAGARWTSITAGSHNVFAAQSDANPVIQIGTTGLRYGAGGASAVDITLARQASSLLKLTGALAGDIRFGMTGANVPEIQLRNATADANPAISIVEAGLNIGAGGASALDLFAERVVPTANILFHFGAAAAGTTGVWIDVTTPGIILKDSANQYWRVTIDATGALTTTSIGASLP